MRTPLLLSCLALTLVSCRSGVAYPERMYVEVLGLTNSHGGTGGLRTDVRKKMEGRFETVERWTEEGMLATPEDALFAALTLSLSDHATHLELSKELAIASAEQGEQRGYLAFAIASDKLAFERGESVQRYGTHIMYQPVLQRFELHPPVDPQTTDEERAAMGVPPLEQLRAEVATLNEEESTDLLRDRVQVPLGD